MWLMLLSPAELGTLKVAVMVVSAVKATAHGAMPVHVPDHPLKVEPAAGVAVRVTAEPFGKAAVQVAPQLMPAGLLVTVPVPVPASTTVSWTAGAVSNVAVTVVSAAKATVHVPVPEQAPDQPVKLDPAAGAGVSTTEVPIG